MSKLAENLPNDPAVLKAMIAALQAENAKMAVTLRVHDQLVQTLRLRIAKLQKLAFGKSSEKIEREIEQLELALEDLLVAVAEEDDAPIDEGQSVPSPEKPSAPVLRRRPRVSDAQPHASAANLILAPAALTVAVIYLSWARMSANCLI